MAGKSISNFAKHLKALRRRTTYPVMCAAWTKDASLLETNPHHLISASLV